jgi:spore coat polysaccharide biosynthesis protein SpsF
MKTGYFITARLKSSRLKRKILLPLNGPNVLDHVIKRCKSLDNVEDVVLCTSTNPQDSELYDYALNHKIKFYAGSEDDVLLRLLDAANYYGIDAFLSITADNPLHSIEIGNEMVKWARKMDFDFIFVSGLPIGTMPYFINTKALEIAIAMKKKSDTEIWGPFVNRPDFFKIGYLNVNTKMFSDQIRLTCDYQEDYNFLKSIYHSFSQDYIPTIKEVADIISKKKLEIVNNDVQQTVVPQKTLDDIKLTFDKYMPLGKDTAEKIGRKLSPGSHSLTINI